MKTSETITENILRKFYGPNCFIEKSAIPNEYGFVSKKGSGAIGFPDFFKDCGDFVIIIEAKATKHDSAKNEVCQYLRNNEITKDMLGIAISGQTETDLNVTYFLRLYGADEITEISTVNKLYSIESIINIYKKSRKTELVTIEHLTKILHLLNQQFHDGNIVRDTDRSLFFSGLMIALKDATFRNTYRGIQAPANFSSNLGKLLEAHNLNEAIITAIDNQLQGKINNLSKEYNWKDKFSFIKTIDCSLLTYKKIIRTIEMNVFLPFENQEKLDILGKAYKIFLSKAGHVDNKNIILTPDHIKSLMVKLARLTVDDVVLDTCTGSGGFLMESMETMIALAKQDVDKITHIKEKQLIGFETDSVLFALACSNMFLHGDGRTNLIFRSSLLDDNNDNVVNSSDEELLKFIKDSKPTKVIINPPYENNKSIRFALQAIQYLEDNGKLIIIMPTPTLTQNQGELTKKLLQAAKLECVIKMPEKLFAEQKRTVNTSIFCFTKTPHQPTDMVYFYSLNDDGFISVQHKGRVDKKKNWPKLEAQIISDVFNGIERPFVSEKRLIFRGNELNCSGFRNVKNSHYKMVKIGFLFYNQKGSLASDDASDEGNYNFITASSDWKKHSEYTHDCEAIVFAVSAAGSLGKTHYVKGKFIASNLCIILTDKKNTQYPICMKFYKYYFDAIREQLRSDLADGTSKLTISPANLMEYFIEYIPFDEQQKFVKDTILPYENMLDSMKQAELNLRKGIASLSEKH